MCALCHGTVTRCALCAQKRYQGDLEVSRCLVHGCHARFLGAQALAQHIQAAHRDLDVPAWSTGDVIRYTQRGGDHAEDISHRREDPAKSTANSNACLGEPVPDLTYARLRALPRVWRRPASGRLYRRASGV